MRKELLQYLKCPQCGHTDFSVHAFRAGKENVESGLIICGSCRAWFPVVESIPIVSINPLLVDAPRNELRRVWGDSFRFEDLSAVAPSARLTEFAAMQNEQIEYYNEEAVRYDSEIADTVFWRSVVQEKICPWGASDPVRRGTLLEVGCGTGASTVQLAKLGCRIVAFDICSAAAKRALAKAQRLGVASQIDILVSEAEVLPFRDGIFQASVFTGVLHHVAHPEHVLAEISRVLAPGGQLYGHENNASAFRFLFDLLMKLKQLWHEEAGSHPLLVAGEVKKWGAKAGLALKTESIVFLPPHFFNLFSQTVAQKLLVSTDRFFSYIPWLRNQGGLLIISGTKNP